WRYILAVLNAIGLLVSQANAGVCARVISSQVESVAADTGHDLVPGDDYFGGLNQPFGPVCLDLGIGPLRMRLDGLSPRQAEQMRWRVRPFLALVRAEGPLFDRGLENFLRILTASHILESGGFLLHASGVVRAGRAYVFFGPSGSGKTTVTHLSPGDQVLSDDLTLVVRTRGR